MLRIDRNNGWLIDDESRRFDPVRRSWLPHSGPSDGEPVDLIPAVAWLQLESGHPVRTPVGVIGPRDATVEQIAIAEEIGRWLAEMRLTVICGGRQGVMEAVCRGAASKGGISIGLLPDADPSLANPYVTVPIATGIGEARNALIARAAFCLVVIGNSHGTLSEVALGLQFGKKVVGIAGAAEVIGVLHCEGVEEVIKLVAHTLLALADQMAAPC
jgi:uncharacterized protein (TIGR00725 family)